MNEIQEKFEVIAGPDKESPEHLIRRIFGLSVDGYVKKLRDELIDNGVG